MTPIDVNAKPDSTPWMEVQKNVERVWFKVVGTWVLYRLAFYVLQSFTNWIYIMKLELHLQIYKHYIR